MQAASPKMMQSNRLNLGVSPKARALAITRLSRRTVRSQPKTGNKGKGGEPGQPKQHSDASGPGSGKASKPKSPEPPQKGAGKGKPDADGWVQVRRKAADEDFRLFSQDWDKPLLEFGRLADTLDALQADKILEAVILCKAAEAKIAQTMIVGSGKQYSVLLIVPGKTASSQRVPGRIGEARKFIDADVCRFVSQGQSGPKVFGIKKLVAITARKSVGAEKLLH